MRITLAFYNGKVNIFLSCPCLTNFDPMKFVLSACLSSTLFYLEPSNAHLLGSLQYTRTPFHAQLFDPFQCTIIRREPI